MKVVAFGNGRTLNTQILEAIKESTMKSITTIYKVYGCDTSGSPILYAEFLDLKEACQYAVSKQGKIHYNLPEVEKHTYTYDPKTKEIDIRQETIEPAKIYYMNKI